jgi:hypothetical protein
MALYSIAKCIGSRNNFTLFAKNLLENFPEKEIGVERAGKCNLAAHLLNDGSTVRSKIGARIQFKQEKDQFG